MAKVLVVGGAGYVGATACAWLEDEGHEITVLDNLSTGHFEFVRGKFILGQAGDLSLLEPILEQNQFDCVMHFAAASLVGESVVAPKTYCQNNVIQTWRLLEALGKARIRNFIFSSTCAIFGDPTCDLISENLPKKPNNPYGVSKLETEKMLEHFAARHGLRSIILRYFNAAGAEPRLRVGEWHSPETHLIPKVLQSALLDQPFSIFGGDYPTPDGTCVRDYIHVWDLARAHGLSLQRLLSNPDSENGTVESFNLGSGTGYSVLEVVRACEKVLAKPVKTQVHERRPGDPPRLVADPRRAAQVLGFSPQVSDLSRILRSALEWETKKNEILRPAIFLDRDGTLNEDPGYLNDFSKLKLLPRVGEGLAMLRKAGYLLIVISNQSGVGRGLIRNHELEAIHLRLNELLSEWCVKIDHFELCFHRPEEGCDCRKPKPSLLLKAAETLKVDIARSFMVGDKISDLEAGHAAGCKGSALVLTGAGEGSAQLLKDEASFTGASLVSVAEWILGLKNESSGSVSGQIPERDRSTTPLGP